MRHFPFIGLSEILILVPLLAMIGAIARFWVSAGRRATRFGYASAGEYLRSPARSDEEKRDAADLAMKGLVFCVLGMMFSPFVLVGLVPLFYGGRKLVYASMGLGLVDDADQPDA